MPELPEVETTVNELKEKVLKRTFLDIWTDAEKLIKKPSFEKFKKSIIGKKIEEIERKGKLTLIKLNDNKAILIHQKLTGHLLAGKWKKQGKEWKPLGKGELRDPMNRFIHIIFFLDKDLMLALSDLRKFARIEFWDYDLLMKSKRIKELGIDPMDKSFTFLEFEKRIKDKSGKIKQVLMNQKLIAGIGNIYSDEILFYAGVKPSRRAKNLKKNELKKIYTGIKKILREAIKVKGDSFSDYRRPDGSKGRFQDFSKVYRREGKKCFKCNSIILREKIGGRSAHYCPKCQK